MQVGANTLEVGDLAAADSLETTRFDEEDKMGADEGWIGCLTHACHNSNQYGEGNLALQGI